MRISLFAGGFLSLLLILTGCGNHKENQKPLQESYPVPRIMVVGGGEFPEYMVGDWQCHTEPWVIHFDKNGSLSWLVHPVGGVMQTAEGGSFEEATRGDQKATFFAALGPISGQYDPATHILKLSIAWIAMRWFCRRDLWKARFWMNSPARWTRKKASGRYLI